MQPNINGSDCSFKDSLGNFTKPGSTFFNDQDTQLPIPGIALFPINNDTVEAARERCNPHHPLMPVGQECEYGPSYSDLGEQCKMCPHPYIVVSGMSCQACPAGEGPDIAHKQCIRCFDGSFSGFGVCNGCPIGTLSNEGRSECVDYNECLTNPDTEIRDGGCDILSAKADANPCINEPFTSGFGFRCSTCPVGFQTVLTYEDFTHVRPLTHGTADRITVKKRLNGSICVLPPPPPPAADGSRATSSSVQPTISIQLVAACQNFHQQQLHRHVVGALALSELDLDKVLCVETASIESVSRRVLGSTRRRQAQTPSSGAAAWFTFVIRTAEKAPADTRNLLSQLSNVSSALHNPTISVLQLNTTVGNQSSSSPFVADDWENNPLSIPEWKCPAGTSIDDSGVECEMCTQGKYNPTPGTVPSACKPCPPGQTSTMPFHTCHCDVGTFNTSYVNIRCFEPDAAYYHSFVLDDKKSAPDCKYDVDVWRGTECCRSCPEPEDQSRELPADYPYETDQCVDCSSIGSSVDAYGNPTGDHGIMTPRVLVGWSMTESGTLRAEPGVDPLVGAFGPQGPGNGGEGGIVQLNMQLSQRCREWVANGRDADECAVLDNLPLENSPGQQGTVVEMNIFRCPYQDNAETGAVGSCLGQIPLDDVNSSNLNTNTNSSLNGSNRITVPNETQLPFGNNASNRRPAATAVRWTRQSICQVGYTGALCGTCEEDYVMTNDGCQKCDPAGMGSLFVSALVAFVAAYLCFKLLIMARALVQSSAASDEPNEIVSLRRELEQLSKPALFLRAEDVGVNKAALDKAMSAETVAAIKKKIIELIVEKELERVEDTSSDEEVNQDFIPADETPRQRANRHWRKAQIVLQLVHDQRSALLVDQATAAGLLDIKDSAEDAKHVLGIMKRGVSGGKTQFKIGIGLFQVLGGEYCYHVTTVCLGLHFYLGVCLLFVGRDADSIKSEVSTAVSRWLPRPAKFPEIQRVFYVQD